MNLFTLECKILKKEDITKQEAEKKGIWFELCETMQSEHPFQIAAYAFPGPIARDLHQCFQGSRLMVIGNLIGSNKKPPIHLNITQFRVILRP